MNLLDFIQHFPDEESCKSHFRDMRINRGVTCKQCHGQTHYWLKGKWQFECKYCHFRTTLKSGTSLEHSNLSFRTWYLAILLMTATKKGISACELQRQLNHRRYQTVWFLMHRIRSLMGKRDDLYDLQGMIEFDEGFFEKELSRFKRQNLQRGKGSERQQNVGVLAESTPLENLQTSKKSKHCRYFKMKVLPDQKADSVNELMSKSLEESCFVFSDKSKSYLDIAGFVEGHIMETSSKETTVTTLKWVHIAISNAKRNFLGVYHKINGKYLQNYLNEFVYKLNRRYFKNLFERVIIAAIFPYWYNSV